MPEDLSDCDSFLTISFGYFAASMRLFKDPIWVDQYESGAFQFNLPEAKNIHQMAPCILFNFRYGVFDEPEKIVKLYIKTLDKLCGSDKSLMETLNNLIVKLKSQSQKYCHGATITMVGAALRSSTDVSITVMPSPDYQNVSHVQYRSK